MNICFYLAQLHHGGIGRVVSIVANELNKSPDYHVTALCHSDLGGLETYPADFEITYLYHETRTVASAMLKDHYIHRIKRYLREHKVDLLIVCDELFYPAAVIAGENIRTLCWFHTSPTVSSDYRFQRMAKSFGFSRADGIVALTRVTADILRKQYPNKHIAQIYNPVDQKLLDQSVSYDPDAKRIIAAGRLSYPKYFERMIRVADMLKEELPDVEWHIYGEGDDRTALEEMIRERKLEDTVRLMGQHSDLYELYPRYAAMALTSRYEGFPMTLIEAAACGLPLVSFDVLTGPSEIISDHVNGFLCEDNNEQQMADRIKELFSDRELRIKMSEESRNTAQKFRLNGIMEQWRELIESDKGEA